MTGKENPVRKITVRFLLFLTFVVLFLSLGKFFHFDTRTCHDFLAGFPLWLSAIIFVVLCVTVTSFVWIGPKDIFLVAAALLYGPYLSAVLVYIVEMVSLPIFFLMSRRLGRGFVEQKLKGRIKQLDETIADTSFWSIFLLRFFIIIPFRFLDLFMGLTKISLRKYFLIALIGSPLRVFFLQFFLSLGLDTIVDVNKFSAYMESHPYIAMAAIIYTLGAFVAIFMMKRMAGRKRAKDEELLSSNP